MNTNEKCSSKKGEKPVQAIGRVAIAANIRLRQVYIPQEQRREGPGCGDSDEVF